MIISDLFQTLSHPTRTATLEILSRFYPTPVSLTAIAKTLNLSLYHVSKHVTELEKKGFVLKKELGQYVAIHLKQEPLIEIEKFLKILRKD